MPLRKAFNRRRDVALKTEMRHRVVERIPFVCGDSLLGVSHAASKHTVYITEDSLIQF